MMTQNWGLRILLLIESSEDWMPGCWFFMGFWVDTSVGTKKVEDIMPIATGHEREELEAELQVFQECLWVFLPFVFVMYNWITLGLFFLRGKSGLTWMHPLVHLAPRFVLASLSVVILYWRNSGYGEWFLNVRCGIFGRHVSLSSIKFLGFTRERLSVKEAKVRIKVEDSQGSIIKSPFDRKWLHTHHWVS